MDLNTLLLVLAVIIAPVALVGHLYLAYVVAPRRAVEATTGFFTSEDGREMVGEIFRDWIASKKGTETIGQIIGAAADVIKAKLEGFFTGAAGNAKKAATDKAVSLLSSFDFGHPVINGIWSMMPADTKKDILGRLQALLAHATAAEAGMTAGAAESAGGEFKL